MDLSKLMLAALVSGGVVHPYGHVQQGAENGTPTTIDYKNMVEDRRGHSKNAADETGWHGAGFKAQDRLKNALNSPEVDLMTGLYKILYPVTQKKFSPTGIEGGDIGGMARSSGNKHVKELLAASSVWDVLKGAGLIDRRPGNLNFTVIDGAPGLIFQKRFETGGDLMGSLIDDFDTGPLGLGLFQEVTRWA